MNKAEMKKVFIEAKGMIKDNWYSGFKHMITRGDHHCPVTALTTLLLPPNKPHDTIVLEKWRAAIDYFENTLGINSVVHWNDNSTEQEVLAGLDKVIATL